MKQNILCLIIGIICFTACNSPKQQPQEINEATTALPSVIEIVTDADSLSIAQLQVICRKYNIDTTSIYQWKNHLVIYDVLEDSEKILKDISATFPKADIKLYEKPFYVFDRKNCQNSETANEWSHTIMTANLVNDSTLQREYMDYHVTQSEKWPEIANGFCNANFQQLLIFRNERQLMLIISIPEGENLDELNPKTTENNPRVDDWNALMSKYQEGIEGAEQGSAWVTFSQVR